MAVTLLAAVVFARHPRPILIPVLLLACFLFRETGALMVLPMIWWAGARGRLRGALVWSVVGAGILAAVYVSYRRPSIMGAVVLDEQMSTIGTFGDAVAAGAVRPSLAGVARHVWHSYREALRWDGGLSVCRWLLMLNPASLVVAASHELRGLTGVRHLLFTFPLTAILMAALLARISGRWRWPLVAALCIAGFSEAASYRTRISPRVLSADRRFVDGIGHDDATIVAGPFDLYLDYALRHYPVRYAFPPENRATLDLLCRHYVVGTLILPAEHALEDPRYDLEREVGWVGQTYRVYRLRH